MDFNIEDYEEEKNFILNNPSTPTLKLMRDFAKQYHKQQLNLNSVVNWLPFKEENYSLLSELSKKNKLYLCYDDGTIIKYGEEEPLAKLTWFAQQS